MVRRRVANGWVCGSLRVRLVGLACVFRCGFCAQIDGCVATVLGFGSLHCSRLIRESCSSFQVDARSKKTAV